MPEILIKSHQYSIVFVSRLILSVLILCVPWMGTGFSFFDHSPSWANSGSVDSVQTISVVMDNNYPPYSYTDAAGNHIGITVDQWRLFEKRTGIKVTLLPMQWSEAFRGMKAGQYDVIDTISYNKERTLFLDYTKAYATIDVPIFYANQISGITDAKTLRGFSVAVKKGDLAIQKLQEVGVTTILEYPSAEALIEAASKGQVVTFVMGKPPAMHFLYKYGIHNDFKYSENLYTSQFFRAVKKGDSAVLSAINAGFDQITEAEYAAINEKYMGKSGASQSSSHLPSLMMGAAGSIFAVLVLGFLWRQSVREQVKKRVKTLEQRIHQTEERCNQLEIFNDAMLDLYFVIDQEHVIIDYMASRKQDLYLPPEVFIGKGIQELYPPEIAQALDRVISECFETGVNQSIQYLLPMPEGPLYYEARLVLHENVVVAVVRNIDEATRMSLAIQENLEALKYKNEEMERFIYVVTHDLNSPLIGIKGYVSMLIEDFGKGDTAGVLSDLRKVDETASKAQKILECILEYASVANGECKKNEFSMKQLSEEIITLLEPAARSREISLQSAPEMPMAYGDPRLILLVLRKLVENSIQHMNGPETGMRLVTIGSKLEGETVIFYVEDSGPGIPIAKRSHVFDLFEKGSLDNEGMGLGLAIVKRIIEQHGGSVWIDESQLGGAVVCFTLNKKI